jgi:hypothetical protein
MLKSFIWAGLAAGIWLLSAYGPGRPQAEGPDAPKTRFSAARADAVLERLLDPERPHPVGSAAAQTFRSRLLHELDLLGVHARATTEMSCYREVRWSALACGTITNITAQVSPGTDDKTVLVMAHADSVAAGPGAADDGSGVAILLECIRALKARRLAGLHPVVVLFTDGEEAGMLGASAYLRDSSVGAGIGAVINVEARGNRGPSYLFQTSAGNSGVIDLYAHSVNDYATSSLYGEIYKYLPNDTDLTPMLATGAPAYNFAFIGGGAQYHTPLDRRRNIDPRSLQQQGSAVLQLADALSHADLASLKAKPDAIYLDVLGRWLPRLAQPWALPLSLVALGVIVVAGLLTGRERRTLPRRLLSALAPLLLLAGAIGMGFVLHGVAVWISGQPDPSFARPLWLRLSLGFGVFALALATARIAGAITCWLWFAVLAVACAIYAPGLTPYFLFPSLVAAPLLLATVRGGRDTALLLGALAAMLIWIGLNQESEAIMGLKLHPLFMASAGFGLLGLLPVLGKILQWRLAFAFFLLLSVGLVVIAGFTPVFSEEAPERLNLRYAEMNGKAFWLADPVPILPQGLRAVANFSLHPQRLIEPAYVAPAGRARNPPPRAAVARDGDRVRLDLDADADEMMLVAPREAGVAEVTIGGIVTPISDRRISILCATPDCGRAHIELHLSSTRAFELLIVAQRYGLPPEGENLLKSRPSTDVPSQAGDLTMLVGKIAIPPR